MARVFISHSSLDNEPAERIKIWLGAQGFETPFLDYDKHAGIPPGADWEKTLYREIERSEAVVIVQTPNWLDSKWCFAEFTQARALGKPIFPVIEAPTGSTLISPDIQTLNLLEDREGGLERLSRQLTEIALDAQGGFSWDASRPPYPGLLAFQEEDAALYFGRDDDIRRLIERLNARRAQGGAKLIALLGASGSGKSSLLRAGVIPRLKRAGRNWIVLPPMRPQVRPVDELARSLAVATGADWRRLREQFTTGDLATGLSDTASDLRVSAEANEADIMLPIDQAEELFGAADPAQARRFFEILNVMLSGKQPYIAIMAIRSDYLGSLQSAEGFTARFEQFSLGPMPIGRIPQIIEGPARVAGLGIDEELVHEAARDAETEDALPLLAFALRELYDQSSDDNYLSLDEYKALGDETEGLTPLENAVRKAADDVLIDAKPGEDELTALRDAFVPAMVRVNDQGEYVRRPARWDELPAKSHPLLERLTKARLLIVSQDGDTRMLEIAHEALLRKWPRLRSWLDDAREFLTGKQQLEVDLRDYQRAPEADKTAALLTGIKLNRARGWLLERPHQLAPEERALIQASIDHAEAEGQRKARTRRNTTRAAIAAALVLAAVAIFAGFQWQDANRKTIAADEARIAALEAQQEAQEQTRIARQAKDEAVPWIIRATWRSGAEYDTEPGWVTGVRGLIEHADSIINLDKVRFLSPVPIFISGPHGSKFNWNSNEFARYNPEFVTWASDYLIPGADDESFRNATQSVYEDHLSTLARAYCISYQMLQNDVEVLDEMKRQYMTMVESGSAGKFLGEPLLADYFRAMELRASELGQPGIFPYYSHVSAAFWVRREIDGTADEIISAIRKLLRTYDSAFADECGRIDRRFSESMADGFPGTWRVDARTYATFGNDGRLTIRAGRERTRHLWEFVASGQLKIDGRDVTYRVCMCSPTLLSELPGVGAQPRLSRLYPEQETARDDPSGKSVDFLNATEIETSIGKFSRTTSGVWRGPNLSRADVSYTEIGRDYFRLYLFDERSDTELEFWINEEIKASTSRRNGEIVGKVLALGRPL